MPPTSDLFDPEASARVILAQNLVPVVATASTFLIFRYGV